MALEENNSVITTNKNLLKYQFKELENFIKYFNTFFKEAQTLENLFFSLLEDRWLDTATGYQLDRLGSIVGIARNSLTDDQYRYYLKFQIGKNTSRTTQNDLIALLRIITGANIVYIREYFPASIVVGCDVVVSDEIALFINDKFQEIVGAGIKFHYIQSFDDENAFGYGPASLQNIKGYGTGKYSDII